MNKVLRDQVLRLPPEERLELIGELWDSLDPSDVPLTPEQIEELDRRFAAYELDPSRGIPLEEFLARLEARSG
jgi:putative addiction module component (TIGR02574 family)